MTRHQVLQDLKQAFRDFEDPTAEARALVREALDVDFNELILNNDPVPPADLQKIEEWKTKRIEGVPLAYLSGRKAFHKYEFKINPGVLIPRPETELLVFTGSKRLTRAPRMRFADLGCGSGCVGITLAKEFENAEIHAVDISPEACLLTEENANFLGVKSRVQVLRTDVTLWKPDVLFDLIVANPPYIAVDDPQVDPAVRKFEPALALFSGADGLEALRQWIPWAKNYLRPNGILAMEIGTGQSKDVENIMSQAGYQEIQTLKDFGGHDRIVSAKKGS